MSQNLLFTSGLPRSGSTLLMNILGQNPNFHVTPTNSLIGAIQHMKQFWTVDESFKAQGLELVEPRIKNMMKGMISGFYKEEFSSNKTVIDKSRNWVQNIELIEEILQRPIKILYPIRDVRSVVASFEKIYRETPMQFTPVQALTLKDRVEQMLKPESPLGYAINIFFDTINKKLDDRLIIIPYKSLTSNPELVMNLIHESLGFDNFKYDFDNVEQLTYEDDSFHGYSNKSLHTIRKKVEPEKYDSWKDILTPQIADKLNEEYRYINDIANK